MYCKGCVDRAVQYSHPANINLQLLDYSTSESHPAMKNMLYRALLKLSKKSSRLPTCLVLSDVTLQSQTGSIRHQSLQSGSFGDVEEAFIGNHRVAIKKIRYYETSNVPEIIKVS